MKALAVDRHGVAADWVGRILCHDIRGDHREILFRKGHALRAGDLSILNAASWDELHLLELEAEDVGQREAGQRLAESLSSAALEAAPSGHKHVLKSRHDGLVRIDVAALQSINSIPGIAVFTLRDNDVVTTGRVVAQAQITPLAITRASLDAATDLARERGPLVRVVPFLPCEAIVWNRDDRLLRPLTAKLQSLGCSVREVVSLPRDPGSIREALEARVDSRASLFFVTGSNALDPLDPVFRALEQMGAVMQRIGLPVHPGTLLWLASWQSITIIGLPSCGLGAQLTALDLILPKLLAEGRIADEDLASLGHGGILNAQRHVLSIAAEESEPAEAR